MSDERPARGPDFLPYPLPEPPLLPAPVLEAPAGAAPAGPVPPAVLATVAAGTAALLSLLLVTWLAGARGVGAVLAVVAAVVAVLAARAALQPGLGDDRRTATQVGRATGVAAAVVALLALAVGGGSQTQAQPPVQVPSPAPSDLTATPSPQASPTPLTAPPGAVNGFGVPSEPGPPLSQSPDDTGTLYGHAVSTAGAPLPGVTVTVTRATAGDTSSTPECPLRITTRTDAQGVYRLRLCQLGEGLGYTVELTLGAAAARSTVFINAGQTTVYDVILPVRR